MDDCMDSIDLSWLDQYIKTTEGGVTYLPEIMNKIKMKILYINNQNEIIKVIKKDIPLEIKNNESFISENTLINYIHKYRDFNNNRYQCVNILKYHICMDPQTIFENIHNDKFTFSDESCFYSYDLPCNISFPPSLFIFHSVNTVYLIFNELLLVETKMDPISLIKKNNKNTQKLRIGENLPNYFSKRKTRKR